MNIANDNQTAELAIELRPARETDRNFVLSSWLRSCAEGPEFRCLRRCVFFALYEPVVKALLERATVVVACMPDADDVILGWVAIEDDCIHYVLVKPRWRGLGIAKKLLAGSAEMPITYTHLPSAALERCIPPTWTYDTMRRFQKAAA